MTKINRDQFKDMVGMLHEPDDGFSLHPTTGDWPSSGHMVSQAGHERRFDAGGRPVNTRDLKQYGQDKARQLARPNRYYGGWHDPKSHDITLDVSQRYDQHDEARTAMIANNQDALYNVNEGHSEPNVIKHGIREGGLGGVTGPNAISAAKRAMNGGSVRPYPAPPKSKFQPL